MSTLYEITNTMEHILQMIEQEDFEGEDNARFDELLDWLKTEEDALEEKVDAYCCVIKEMEARASDRMEEVFRMKDLARVDENKAKALRERLLYALEELHIDKPMHTKRFRVAVVKNGGLAPLVIDPDLDTTNLPCEWLIAQDPKLDTKTVRRALEAGDVIEWASFGERGKRVAIK